MQIINTWHFPFPFQRWVAYGMCLEIFFNAPKGVSIRVYYELSALFYVRWVQNLCSYKVVHKLWLICIHWRNGQLLLPFTSETESGCLQIAIGLYICWQNERLSATYTVRLVQIWKKTFSFSFFFFLGINYLIQTNISWCK